MLELEQRGLIIAASVPIPDRLSLIGQLQEERKRIYEEEISDIELGSYLPFGSDLLRLDDFRRKQLGAMMTRVGSGLRECGIDNSVMLLPTEDEFIVVKPSFLCKEEWSVTGKCNAAGNYIRINLSPERGFEDLQTQFVTFHEASHFVSARVYQLDNNKQSLVCQAIGLMAPRGELSTGVVWEEPVANLFALFCIDSDMDFNAAHSTETVFLLAMIDKIASLQNISPLAVFKRLVRAKTLRDFSVQGELADVLGNETVRMMNHTRYVSWTGDTRAYDTAARSGGFFETYDRQVRLIGANQAVTVSEFVPGIRGAIKSM